MLPSINAFWKRRLICFYDTTLLGILVALAVLYFKTNAIGHLLPEEMRGLPAYTAWFGVLGSIAVSFKGLSDWGPDEALWGGRWPLWYVGRPFSGLIVGIMTFVLNLSVGNTVGSYVRSCCVHPRNAGGSFLQLSSEGRGTGPERP